MNVLGKVLRGVGFGLLALAAIAGLVLLVLRFGDGPTAMVAGGAFSTGELQAGAEPDWAFLRDRAEVEFQLLEPARSRTTWVLEHDGHIYIPCGYMTSTLGRLWKRWPIEAERDGRALLRVDDRIYPRTLRRVRESPALPFLAGELVRKYLGGAAAPAQGSAEFDRLVAAVLQQVRDESLWIFELAPRTDAGAPAP